VIRSTAIFVALALALWCHPSTWAAERGVAVFDFELIDTSLQGATYGTNQEEQERLVWVGKELRKRLMQTGRFEVVDVTPLAAKRRLGSLQSCGGCDAELAHELGAKLAITGWVQKVSNLILNMNIAVRDADTGKLMAGMSVDMRGNTQESWSRALNYLVVNRLLGPGGL
jgi:Protein of unknown function (DUF2380)